jgi:hypothetical protein
VDTQGIKAELDDELMEWLALTTNDETREVIVEARVPIRRVRLDAATSRGPRPQEVITEEGPTRAEALQQVQDFLTEVIGRRLCILSAAGAIAVVATKNQVRQIAGHPFVKAVRANRRFQKRPKESTG